MREAPVFSERTSVGLDVHARSIVGCGLDTVRGAVALEVGVKFRAGFNNRSPAR